LTIAGLVLLTSSAVHAAEPFLDFVEGLRARGYYEYAVLYLEQLESRDDVPRDIQSVLDFEMGVTLARQARANGNEETRTQLFDRAEALLKQFAQKNPEHLQKAGADEERAMILMDRARSNIRNALLQKRNNEKNQLRQQARAYVQSARTLYQSAHDSYDEAFQKFPSYVSPDDKEEFAARNRAEINYMKAQLNLAQCAFQEGRTYDSRDSEFTELLRRAADEYGAMHEKYRILGSGLLARMWQGRCFQEQEKIGEALGIYNELLEHPDESATMRRIKDQTLEFKLICLNHPDHHDHQQVIREANAWLDANKKRWRTKAGLEIRWQRSLAAERRGMDSQLAEMRRGRYLRLALEDARELGLLPGEHKTEALAMTERLLVALKRGPADPENFQAAMSAARNVVQKMRSLRVKIDQSGEGVDVSELEANRDELLQQAVRLLTLALRLADSEADLAKLNSARYLLSHVYYLSGRNYDSAILGEFVGKSLREKDPDSALHAAYLAMAAYLQAYNAEPPGKRSVELRQIERVCELITTSWPDSNRANDARMTLGRMYEQQNRSLDAAEIYRQVPPTAEQYATAQLAAAQSFWKVYVAAVAAPENSKPAQDERDGWQEAAMQHFRNGIRLAQQQEAEDDGPRDDLITAKVGLAQILVGKGEYTEAIGLLSEPPHAVMQAVRGAAAKQSGPKGIGSQEFAGLCYQLLLRCYVATQQIDQALEAMDELEQITEKTDDDRVATVYLQLGRKIKEEIDRLAKLDQPRRLQEVRESFHRFLDEVFRRKDRLKYGALLWIAETYTGLGEGMAGQNGEETDRYFAKAAETYEAILNRGDISEARRFAVMLRLVSSQRQEGDFPRAEELIIELLDANNKSLAVQREAALLHQDWGTSGEPKATEKLLIAINGLPHKPGGSKADIWGWGQIAQRLRRVLDSGRVADTKRVDLLNRIYRARYNVSWCRRQYGLAQNDSDKRNRAFRAARREIEAFARLHPNLDNTWVDEFNMLNRQLLGDLGEPVADLSWPDDETAESSVPVAAKTTRSADRKRTRSPSATATSRRSSLPQFGLAVLVAALAAGGVVFLTRRSSKRSLAAFAAARRRPVEFRNPAAAAKSPSGTSRSGKRVPRKQPATGSGVATGEKSASVSASRQKSPRSQPPRKPKPR
jgi:hypothetical protein